MRKGGQYECGDAHESPKINHLLNTEISAVETYEQALQEKEWNVLGPDPQIQALFHILVDHVRAASQLATEVQRLGGRPVNGTKAWDRLSHLRMDAATLFGDANPFGDKAALEALKEGEESGLSTEPYFIMMSCLLRSNH